MNIEILILLASFLSASSEQTSRAPKELTQIVPMTEVQNYLLVHYFANKTYSDDVKVHDLSMSYNDYFLHMYFGWKEAEKMLSRVAVAEQDQILGANMVMKLSRLSEMYAPGVILEVLNFVLKCYEHATLDASRDAVYISTLRASNNTEINTLLIESTAELFSIAAPPNSVHLIWEHRSKEKHLKSLGYVKVACGVKKSIGPYCDWKELGVPAEEANRLCLFKNIKQN